jgi:hypothetical protein
LNWARAFYRDVAEYPTGGAYVDFLTEEETDNIRVVYGPNYDLLVEVKTKFDPQNLLHVNKKHKASHCFLRRRDYNIRYTIYILSDRLYMRR